MKASYKFALGENVIHDDRAVKILGIDLDEHPQGPAYAIEDPESRHSVEWWGKFLERYIRWADVDFDTNISWVCEEDLEPGPKYAPGDQVIVEGMVSTIAGVDPSPLTALPYAISDTLGLEMCGFRNFDDVVWSDFAQRTNTRVRWYSEDDLSPLPEGVECSDDDDAFLPEDITPEQLGRELYSLMKELGFRIVRWPVE